MKVMLKHEITCPAGKWASKDSQIALFEEYAQSGSMKTAVLFLFISNCFYTTFTYQRAREIVQAVINFDIQR